MGRSHHRSLLMAGATIALLFGMLVPPSFSRSYDPLSLEEMTRRASLSRGRHCGL